MEPSTEAFDHLVRASHRRINRVVISIDGAIVQDTYYDPTVLRLVDEGSSLSYNRLDDTRSVATLEFQADPAKLAEASDILDPLLFPELTVHSGLMVDGEPEWIQMGVFGLQSTQSGRQGSAVKYQCSAPDRSDRIRTNPWTQPYPVPENADYFDQFIAILLDRAKGFTPDFNVGASTLRTPAANFDEEPWAVLLKLMEAVGCESYFDRYGTACAVPIPDPLLYDPSILLQPGKDQIYMTPVSRSVSNREVYNGVICRASAPWLLFPVSGEVWDEDPLSPTYRGETGQNSKPFMMEDAIATTVAQCQTAAQAKFRQVKGVVEDIDFGLMKDPRINVGEIIDLREDGLRISGRYVLDKYTFPLGRKAAHGTVRRKR